MDLGPWGLVRLGIQTKKNLEFRTENLAATNFTSFFGQLILLFTLIISKKNDY
jgi:hypothetical protein